MERTAARPETNAAAPSREDSAAAHGAQAAARGGREQRQTSPIVPCTPFAVTAPNAFGAGTTNIADVV